MQTALLPLLLTAPLLGGDDLTDRFELPDGLTVELWAESPQLYNPTAMDVDPRGRLWVTEAVNYRRWGGRNPGLEHPDGDRVMILEDTDGDGRADSSKVFVQDADLTAPLGICVVPPRVYVSCSPNIFVYTDEDGDDLPDSREVFLTGFGGFDHDHGVHSVVAGDDGWLYIAAGNAGPHIVTGADGQAVRSGSIYTGGSPYNTKNSPGLESDDGMAWTGGIMLRVRPDGTGLHVFADNFRNQYEIARDAFGNCYTEDNDDDGNRGCRTVWVADGARHGYFSADGRRSWRADQRPGQSIQRAHWHADDPGVMPTWTVNGAGGPTGVAVYESGTIIGLEGVVLNCDAGAGVVYAHRPVADGAGYALEPSVFLGRGGESGREIGDGRATWFRPSDVAVGPDGSVFVADWYDPGVGGHGAGDREAYGRILRVQPTYDVAEPRRGLASPAPSERAVERDRLIALGDAALPELRAWLADTDERVVARALQLCLVHSDASRQLLATAELDWTPELRLAALRATWRLDPHALEAVWERLAADASPLVRAGVARLSRSLDWVEREPILRAAARHHEVGDRVSVESIGIGARGVEARLFEALRAEHEAGDLSAASLRELTWRLHPLEAVPTLVEWAKDETLPIDERRRMIDALSFCPARDAADAMFVLAHTGPDDTREHAQWWFRQRGESSWRDFVPAGFGADFGAAELAWSAAVNGAAGADVVELELDVEQTERLWLVVTDGGDGNGCDWADWLEPRFVFEGGEARDVRAWDLAEQGWGSTQLDRDAAGGELRVGERRFERGIGTHAPAKLSLAVPEGARRFQVAVGADFGGTNQGCGSTLEFQVWAESRAPRGVDARRALVLDGARAWAEREEAARALAGEPEGGLWLVDLADRGELDERLVAAATDAIYTNPDLGVRALASAHFPRPGLEALPPVADILALDASAERGREVFRSERARCSSCHRHSGLGLDIGPDLTAIREKYAPAEVLDAVLNPSAAIAFGYDTYLVQTTDGELVSGFLLAEGADLILKDTQGERHVIPTDEVEARRKQDLSVMPEGLAMGVTPRELADLVAFLTRDAEREPTFGPPIRLFDGVSLDGWTWHLENGGRAEDVWSIEDGVLRCAGRPIGYLRTERTFRNFELTLEWRFDPAKGAGNSGVLCRMVGEDKVWPKSIEAQLQSGAAGDIWNIDRFPMQVEEGRTRGRHTERRLPSSEHPLGEWNRYRIRLDRGHLTLEVNGVVQNEASWCEEVPGFLCLQSEGAYIEFRDIVLREILD